MRSQALKLALALGMFVGKGVPADPIPQSPDFSVIDITWTRKAGCANWEIYFGLNDINTKLPLISGLRLEKTANNRIPDDSISERDFTVAQAGISLNYRNGILAKSRTDSGTDGVRVKVPKGLGVMVERLVANDCKNVPIAVYAAPLLFVPGENRVASVGSSLYLEMQTRSLSASPKLAPWIGPRIDTSNQFFSPYEGIATDSLGNLLVGGSDGRETYLLKYNSSGVLQWKSVIPSSAPYYNPLQIHAVKVDEAGNTYVGGDGTVNIAGIEVQGYYAGFVAKFDALGHRLWTKLIDTRQFNSQILVRDLVLDQDGNVALMGLTTVGLNGPKTSSNYSDIYVAKFKADGSSLGIFQQGADGTYANAVLLGSALVAGRDGSLVVAGFTTAAVNGIGRTGNYDMVLIKMDRLGTKVWTKLVGRPKLGFRPTAMAIDSAGSIAVTGYTSSASVYDGDFGAGFVAKFDAQGNQKFLTEFAPGSRFTKSAGISINSSTGEVLVAGQTDKAIGGIQPQGYSDLFLLKLNVLGQPIEAKLQGQSRKVFTISGMARDPLENIFVIGNTTVNDAYYQTGGDNAAFITKFNKSGVPQ